MQEVLRKQTYTHASQDHSLLHKRRPYVTRAAKRCAKRLVSLSLEALVRWPMG